jgi:hypothetical protein
MTHNGAASPAPDHTRRGGTAGPAGPAADRTDRCRHCGFLVAEKSGGLACKSGETCPFYGKEIEYLAPPLPRSMTANPVEEDV